jgi:hypothetical protein
VNIIIMSHNGTPMVPIMGKRTPSTVTRTYDGGRDLNGSAHLMPRALESQSASVACCTLTVSLCAPPAVVPAGQYCDILGFPW